MQLKKLLEKWDLTSLKIKVAFLEMHWEPRDEDKAAAWELYIELITRAATQHLDPEQGDKSAALKSIYDLFALTRDRSSATAAGTRAAWGAPRSGDAAALPGRAARATDRPSQPHPPARRLRRCRGPDRPEGGVSGAVR